MTGFDEHEMVAPLADPVCIARNALSLLEVRKGEVALDLIGKAKNSNPFLDLVRGMAMRETPGSAADSGLAAAEAARQSPGMMSHLIPWLSLSKLSPEAGHRHGVSMQVAISLRLFRRHDLKGWAVRHAHSAGVRFPDGSALLVDVEADKPTQPGRCVCLIDGAEVRSLGAHIASCGISPKAYREFFGLPREHPFDGGLRGCCL